MLFRLLLYMLLLDVMLIWPELLIIPELTVLEDRFMVVPELMLVVLLLILELFTCNVPDVTLRIALSWIVELLKVIRPLESKAKLPPCIVELLTCTCPPEDWIVPFVANW